MSQPAPVSPAAPGPATVLLPADDDAAAAYDRLLGARPAAEPRWSVANASLTLADSAGAPGCAAFEVADVAAAAGLLSRRGAPVDEPAHGVHRMTGHPALGITGDAGIGHAAPAGPGAVTAVDHLVFTAPDEDGAVALFAGRLGLDLRLVQTFGEVRQLFFRSASVVVEVLVGQDESEAVRLWGIAWRTTDLATAADRLAAAGLAVSEIRTGRKAGTRVLTVREPALGMPTLLIEHA